MAGSWRTRAALAVAALALGTTGCSNDTDPADLPSPEHGPTLAVPDASPTGGGSDTGADHETGGSPESSASSADKTRKDLKKLSARERKAAKAAVAAFTKYLRVSDAVMRDGGRHPERLKTVATGVMLAADQNDAASFLNSQQHVVGRSEFDHLSIKHISLSGSRGLDESTVKITACVDVHHTQVQRADGSVVKQKNRKFRWPSTYVVAKMDRTWLIRNLVQGNGTC